MQPLKVSKSASNKASVIASFKPSIDTSAPGLYALANDFPDEKFASFFDVFFLGIL